MTPSQDKSVILLLAHGTPNMLAEMKDYLDNITGGRGVPAHVVEELQHRYAQIGLEDQPGPEPPPLTKWTLQQAKLLEDLVGTPVYVGMRNWHPFIADTVAQMQADGVRHARVLCLAPQNSRTSIGLYKRALVAALGDHPAFTFEFIEGWASEPQLIAAFAQELKAALAQAPKDAAVLFTAHSVPCRTIQGDQPDPYAQEAKQTAALVAQAAGVSRWYFAFQSQGMSGGPWLGPTVEDTLAQLKSEGATHVVLQPIGFVCDHVEILYDIDIAFQQTAHSLGLTLSRPQSLNASPLLTSAIHHALSAAFGNTPSV